MGHDDAPQRTSVCVYVCTFRRNDQLSRLLDTIDVAARAVAERSAVGVVIVDDNVDGRAREVAEKFDGTFELGVHYRHTGAGNISVARNTGLEAAAPLAEWVAMTDDDCEVSPEWFAAYLDLLERTDADAACGPHLRKAPADAPAWLRDHPFLESGGEELPDDASVPHHGQTNNSIIRSSFLLAHPELRFDHELGKLGGEDVVFYHQAVELGLRLRYARGAVVHEEADGSRLTLGYYLRAGLWFGNTQYVTSARMTGLTRPRAVLRGVRRLAEALAHPLRQIARRRSPELVYTASLVATALGLLAGPFGWKMRHPS